MGGTADVAAALRHADSQLVVVQPLAHAEKTKSNDPRIIFALALRERNPPRKDFQIVGEAAPRTSSPVGSEGVFEPLAVDAVWDGSQAGADLIRPAQESRGESNESRPSSGSPLPIDRPKIASATETNQDTTWTCHDWTIRH